MKMLSAQLEKKIGPSEFIFEPFTNGLDGVVHGSVRLASNPEVSVPLTLTLEETLGLAQPDLIRLMQAKLGAAIAKLEKVTNRQHPDAPESPAVAEQSCPPLPESTPARPR